MLTTNPIAYIPPLSPCTIYIITTPIVLLAMLSISPFSPLALSLYSQHTSNGQVGGYLRASSCLKRRKEDTPFFFAGIVRLTAATLLFSLFYTSQTAKVLLLLLWLLHSKRFFPLNLSAVWHTTGHSPLFVYRLATE
jgi:hypothetical protein